MKPRRAPLVAARRVQGRRRTITTSLACSVSLLAMAQAAAAWAQEVKSKAVPASDAPVVTAPRVTAGAPRGFDDLSTAIDTQFDISFQGRRVGSFRAILDGNQFTIVEPRTLVDALGANVVPAEVLKLIGRGLASNEQFLCPPGRTNNCGALPPGVSGVIVDPSNFSAQLFLGREYLTVGPQGPRYLPAPISGPSLIQNINLVAAGQSGGSSTAAGSGGGGSFGAVLDTIASRGRDSLVVQTFIDDQQGGYLQEGYAQHVSDNWRAAAGLIYTGTSPTLANFRLAGVELGSFRKTRLDNDQFSATPIQVVLPRQATVEVYRSGVLILARRLEAGIQTVDSSALPTGSYPIRVVVQDGGAILSDQTQVFVKASDLPPPGKTDFLFRAGALGLDTNDVSGLDQKRNFLPTFDQSVIQVGAARRIGAATAASVTLSAIGSNFYPELSVQTYRGNLRGIAGVAVSTNGGYSAFAGGSFLLRDFSGSLSLRSVSNKDADDRTIVTGPQRYQPFFRSENSIDTTVRFPLYKGDLSLRASYTAPRNLENSYTYGVEYARNLRETRFGTPRLLFDVVKTDQETRATFTVSFFRRLKANSSALVNVGVDAISASRDPGRNGVSPIVDASYTRNDTFGQIDTVSTTGVLIDQSQKRLYTDLHALSPYGQVEGNVALQQDTGGDSNVNYNVNLRTGFAIGGGTVKWGLRQAGEAVILMDIEADKSLLQSTTRGQAPGDAAGAGGAVAGSPPAAGPGRAVAEDRRVTEGGYRVVVNEQPYDRIDVGQKSAIGLPAYGLYSVGLAPDGAPPFDLDLTPRSVPLYPGNVVRLHWKGRKVATLFGRLVDAAGAPVRNARVESSGDRTVTDDQGYFTVTAITTEDLLIHPLNDGVCKIVAPGSRGPAANTQSFIRLGSVACVK